MDLYAEAVAFAFTMGTGRRVLTARGDMSEVSMDRVSRRLRWGRIHRPTSGAYVFGPGGASMVESVKAVLAMSPAGAVAGFHTAAALQGFGIQPSPLIHVVIPPGGRFPQRKGVAAHQTVVPFDPVEVLDIPCTPAARTAVDLARMLPRADALAVLDAALYAGACLPAELGIQVRRLDGLAGARRARELAALADPRPECRQESALRLVLHDGGLRGFIPQLVVARFRLDLGDPSLRVGAEYDGASHLERGRHRTDRARHNALADLDWRMRYFTAHDLYQAPHTIVPTIMKAAGAA